MTFLVVGSVALAASGLTLFSGFGLGTLLTPAFALFFPAELAVGMTALVHFANNLFKLALLGRRAERAVVLRFGLPAMAAAYLGAKALVLLAGAAPLFAYELGGRAFAVAPVNLALGVLLAAFALVEFSPRLSELEFPREFLPLGGVLSGFFGGLSGNQGALRSAFLVRSGLSKESFIATGAAIACLIDLTRLSVYARRFSRAGWDGNGPLLAFACACAFLGAFLGARLLPKVTMRAVSRLVAVLLLLIAAGLAAGLLSPRG